MPSPAQSGDAYAVAARAAAALAAAMGPDEPDDTMLVVAAAAGFFLCMLCGGALPQWGVNSQHVMAGGMVFLLSLTALALVAQCLRPGTFSSESSVTPLVVFLFTGCIGTMLGGMFGGVSGARASPGRAGAARRGARAGRGRDEGSLRPPRPSSPSPSPLRRRCSKTWRGISSRRARG